MGVSAMTVLRIGDWRVDAQSGEIAREGKTARLEVRTLRLLLYLAERAGAVVSIEELLAEVWAGVAVSSDSVYQAVASLRRVLGDDPKQPTYIATVQRLGYRMVATVGPWVEEAGGVSVDGQADGGGVVFGVERSERRGVLVWGVVVALCLGLGALVLARGGGGKNARGAAASAATLPERSIAVLPLLDLTEGMHEEEFADGMTEELIDKISKLSGFRVPPPTSSFFYKGKQIPVAEIARALNVAYVLDGSVRKAGPRLRVAARLIRVENGYVVWSESYDRPFTDILMVQDDIAGEVTKALKASIR